jgi:hypothetical protein
LREWSLFKIEQWKIDHRATQALDARLVYGIHRFNGSHNIEGHLGNVGWNGQTPSSCFFRRHHAPPRRGRFVAQLQAQKLLIAPPVAIQPVDDVSRPWKYWRTVVDTLLRQSN